jgi:hypothetical protein
MAKRGSLSNIQSAVWSPASSSPWKRHQARLGQADWAWQGSSAQRRMPLRCRFLVAKHISICNNKYCTSKCLRCRGLVTMEDSEVNKAPEPWRFFSQSTINGSEYPTLMRLNRVLEK